MLMTHNTQVTLTAMALGMTWGIGTLVIIFSNGVMLGAVAADYLLAGQSAVFVRLVAAAWRRGNTGDSGRRAGRVRPGRGVARPWETRAAVRPVARGGAGGGDALPRGRAHAGVGGRSGVISFAVPRAGVAVCAEDFLRDRGIGGAHLVSVPLPDWYQKSGRGVAGQKA